VIGEAMIDGRWAEVDTLHIGLGTYAVVRLDRYGIWQVVHVCPFSDHHVGFRATRRGARRLALRRSGSIR
jgi:hypothetical protein